jgi:hypothetical protein
LAELFDQQSLEPRNVGARKALIVANNPASAMRFKFMAASP